MTSNSTKMTVSEKLAAKLQESEIGTLLGEEDLEKIAQEAIQKAFFTDRLVPGRFTYDRPEQKPPLLVEMATEAFSKALQRLIEPIVKEMAARPEVQQILLQGALASLPKLLMNNAVSLASAAAQAAETKAYERAEKMINDRLTPRY